jgi:hypothetical protein
LFRYNPLKEKGQRLYIGIANSQVLNWLNSGIMENRFASDFNQPVSPERPMKFLDEMGRNAIESTLGQKLDAA